MKGHFRLLTCPHIGQLGKKQSVHRIIVSSPAASQDAAAGSTCPGPCVAATPTCPAPRRLPCRTSQDAACLADAAAESICPALRRLPAAAGRPASPHARLQSTCPAPTQPILVSSTPRVDASLPRVQELELTVVAAGAPPVSPGGGSRSWPRSSPGGGV
jgi:hypothetical protein